jgi:hypothetical protein
MESAMAIQPVVTFLLDYNLTGQRVLLYGTFAASGWLTLLPVRLVTFADVGLACTTNDREVWRFVQAQRMIVITENRNMKGQDSLEQTIREENTAQSLPVLTIGRVDRLDEKQYCERCVDRMLEMTLELQDFLGAGRIFIP